MKTILLPLSADVFHHGHFELIRKAHSLAEGGKVIVAITDNDLKKTSYLFTLNERFLMAKKAIEDNMNEVYLKNIEVIESEDLIPDLYLEHNCNLLIRGFRNQEDLAYEEKQVAQFKLINPDIVHKCVMVHTIIDYDHKLVSSSLLKAFVKKNVDISKYTYLFIKRAVEEKLNLQLKFGMTGEDFEQVKKTASDLKKFLKNEGVELTIIDFQELVDSIVEKHSNDTSKNFEVCLWAKYRKLIKDKAGFIVIICEKTRSVASAAAGLPGITGLLELTNGNIIFVGGPEQDYKHSYENFYKNFIKKNKTGSLIMFNPQPIDYYQYSLRRLRREVAKIFTPETK